MIQKAVLPALQEMGYNEDENLFGFYSKFLASFGQVSWWDQTSSTSTISINLYFR
jgi:hypothetical protein